jgi:hypothetical protein
MAGFYGYGFKFYVCFSPRQFGMIYEVARFQDGVWRCGLFEVWI